MATPWDSAQEKRPRPVWANHSTRFVFCGIRRTKQTLQEVTEVTEKTPDSEALVAHLPPERDIAEVNRMGQTANILRLLRSAKVDDAIEVLESSLDGDLITAWALSKDGSLDVRTNAILQIVKRYRQQFPRSGNPEVIRFGTNVLGTVQSNW